MTDKDIPDDPCDDWIPVGKPKEPINKEENNKDDL